MGRIRTLKPELLEDEKVAALSHVAFRAFIGAITLADDYGNLRAHAALFCGQVFWARPEVTADDAAAALAELDEVGLITLYEVRGQRYATINGWSKHQRVDKPGKPRIPSISESSRDSHETPEKPPETLATDLGPRTPTKEEDQGASDPRARAHEAPPPLDPEPTDLARGAVVSESATADDGTATGFVASLYDQAALSCDLPPARHGEARSVSARIAAVTHNATGSSSLSPEALAWWQMAMGRVVESRRGGFLKDKSYVRLSWLVKRFDDGTSPVERAAIGDYRPEKRKRDPPRRRDRADELFESVREEEARAEGVIDVEYELDEEYAP